MDVYRRLKQTVPGSFYADFMGAQASTGTAAAGEDVSTDVHTEQGSDWLSFQNPFGSVGRSPGAEKGGPTEPWHILSLRLDWDAASVAFTFRMAALDVSSATHTVSEAPAGRLVLDVYVDINHVPGAGSSALLEGRNAFAASRDSWEYALSLGPSGGVLLRAIPGSSPAVLSVVPMSVDQARRTVRAAVPRSLLRGNPLRWGFIAAAFAAARMGAPPPEGGRSPLPQGTDGPDAVLPGGPLGLLAPLEQQQALAPGGRLAALHLP
jgi:hypothetical protein